MKEEPKKKAVILLGAGFAIPYCAPSSSYLLAVIKRDCVQLAEILQVVIRTLDNYFGKGNYSFETVIAVVESLAVYYTSKRITIGRTAMDCSYMPACFTISRKILCRCSQLLKNNDNAYRNLVQLYYWLIKRICIRVFSYDNCEVSSTNAMFAPLKKYVENLKNKGYNLKFYSLNYDRLIPRIFGNEVDESLVEPVPEDISFDFQEYIAMDCREMELSSRCEVENPDAKRIDFKYDIKEFCLHSFTHFNLHGSRYLTFDMVKHKLVFTLNGWFGVPWGRIESEGGNPSEPLFLSPIIVGQSKTQRSFTQPFKFGFDAFSFDCSTCDALFTFGYSFRDPHINSIMRTYIRPNSIPIEIVVKGEKNFVNHYDYPWFYHTDNKDKISIHTNGMEDYFLSEKYLEII